MLISYRIMRGIAINIWLRASGEGVRTAATRKITRIAYRLCLESLAALTIPSLVRKK